jgi:hypothetical protein
MTQQPNQQQPQRKPNDPQSPRPSTQHPNRPESNPQRQGNPQQSPGSRQSGNQPNNPQQSPGNRSQSGQQPNRAGSGSSASRQSPKRDLDEEAVRREEGEGPAGLTTSPKPDDMENMDVERPVGQERERSPRPALPGQETGDPRRLEVEGGRERQSR